MSSEINRTTEISEKLAHAKRDELRPTDIAAEVQTIGSNDPQICQCDPREEEERFGISLPVRFKLAQSFNEVF